MRAAMSAVGLMLLAGPGIGLRASGSPVATLQTRTTAAYVAGAESACLVRARLGEPVGGARDWTVVLQVRSLVRYERDATSAYAIGASEDISEVVAAGEPDERLLPAGRDSGYPWGANTFTRFVERHGGVDVELETIGLRRRFPPLLGWAIEPIAPRLGRRSVERTLTEFALAVRQDVAAGSAPTTAARRR